MSARESISKPRARWRAEMAWVSPLASLVSTTYGSPLAHLLDVNIAGSMAVMAGVIFAAVYLVAPRQGLLAALHRRIYQRWEFSEKMLAVHLLHHQDLPEAARECHVREVHLHLNWEADFARRVVRKAQREDILVEENGLLRLTEVGMVLAREAMVN